jgi:hypothetical protein
MIPHDVATCWNSNFDMADCVLEYCKPIDTITDKWKLGLTACSLNKHEWELLGELRDTLKVCVHLLTIE